MKVKKIIKEIDKNLVKIIDNFVLKDGELKLAKDKCKC